VILFDPPKKRMLDITKVINFLSLVFVTLYTTKCYAVSISTHPSSEVALSENVLLNLAILSEPE
jgi:hypothetical protein